MGGPGDERGEPWEERLLAELRSLGQAADPDAR